MSIGLTIGKFYPFHLGHDLLLRTAKSQVDHLIVLIGHKLTQQIPVDIRSEWIREMHPDVELLEVLEDIPETPSPWATRALEVLGQRRPDVIFTSEAYGPEWARLMNARHVEVDLARREFAISGSELRKNLGAHWDLLTPPAKAYFARRVSVVGVESSGTTTLARDLAKHFGTVWIPEYGRSYWEGRRYSPQQERWDSSEFTRIARGQVQCEIDLSRRANRLVICDTDALATHVWHRRYVGRYSPELEKLATSSAYDLTLLTAPDFAFIQDGTREGEQIRHQMHDWFQEALQRCKRRYVTMRGCQQQRLQTALDQIEPLLDFPPLDDP